MFNKTLKLSILFSTLGVKSNNENVKKSFLSDAMQELEFGPGDVQTKAIQKSITLPMGLHHHHHHHHHYHHHHHRHHLENIKRKQRVDNYGYEQSKITVKIYRRPTNSSLFHKQHKKKYNKTIVKLARPDPQLSNAVLSSVKAISTKEHFRKLQSQAKTLAEAKKVFLKILEDVRQGLKRNNRTLLVQSSTDDQKDKNSSNHEFLYLEHDKLTKMFHDPDKILLSDKNKISNQSNLNPEKSNETMGHQKGLTEKENSQTDHHKTHQLEHAVNSQRPRHKVSLEKGQAVKKSNEFVKQVQMVLSKPHYSMASPLLISRTNEGKPVSIPVYGANKTFDVVLDIGAPMKEKIENETKFYVPAPFTSSKEEKSSSKDKEDKTIINLISNALKIPYGTKTAKHEISSDIGKNNLEVIRPVNDGYDGTSNKTSKAFKDHTLKVQPGMIPQNELNRNIKETLTRLLLHSFQVHQPNVLGKLKTFLKILANQKYENRTMKHLSKLPETGGHLYHNTSELDLALPLNNGNNTTTGVDTTTTVPSLEQDASSSKNVGKPKEDDIIEKPFQKKITSQRNFQKPTKTTLQNKTKEGISPELQNNLQDLVTLLQRLRNSLKTNRGEPGFQLENIRKLTKEKNNKTSVPFIRVPDLFSLQNISHNQINSTSTESSDDPSAVIHSEVKHPNVSSSKSLDSEKNIKENATEEIKIEKLTTKIPVGIKTLNSSAESFSIRQQSNKNRLLALLHNDTIINLIDNALRWPAQFQNISEPIKNIYNARNTSKEGFNIAKNFHSLKQIAASRKAFETAKKLIQATLAREELYKAEKVFQEKIKEMLSKTDSNPGLNEKSSQGETKSVHNDNLRASSTSSAPNMDMSSMPSAAGSQNASQRDSAQTQKTLDKAAHLEEKIAIQQEKMYHELAKNNENLIQERPGIGSQQDEEAEERGGPSDEHFESREAHENYGDFQDSDEEEGRMAYHNHPSESYAESETESIDPDHSYLRTRVHFPLKETENFDQDSDDEDPSEVERRSHIVRGKVKKPDKNSWKSSKAKDILDIVGKKQGKGGISSNNTEVRSGNKYHYSKGDAKKLDYVSSN
mgnify:CR=1 FL=1